MNAPPEYSVPCMSATTDNASEHPSLQQLRDMNVGIVGNALHATEQGRKNYKLGLHNQKLQAGLSAEQERVQQLGSELGTEQVRSEQLGRDFASLREGYKKVDQEKAGIEAGLRAERQKRTAVEEKKQQLQDDLSAEQAQAAQLGNKLEAERQKCTAVERENKKLQNDNRQFQRAFEASNATAGKVRHNREQVAAENTKLTARVSALSEQFGELQEQTQKEVGELQRQLAVVPKSVPTENAFQHAIAYFREMYKHPYLVKNVVDEFGNLVFGEQTKKLKVYRGEGLPDFTTPVDQEGREFGVGSFVGMPGGMQGVWYVVKPEQATKDYIVWTQKHGTWSNPDAFGGDPNVLSSRYDLYHAQLMAQKMNANVVFVAPGWSGELDENERKESGEALGAFQKNLITSIKGAGGNVIRVIGGGHSWGNKVDLVSTEMLKRAGIEVDEGHCVAMPNPDSATRTVSHEGLDYYSSKGDWTAWAGGLQKDLQIDGDNVTYHDVMIENEFPNHVTIKNPVAQSRAQLAVLGAMMRKAGVSGLGTRVNLSFYKHEHQNGGESVKFPLFAVDPEAVAKTMTKQGKVIDPRLLGLLFAASEQNREKFGQMYDGYGINRELLSFERANPGPELQAGMAVETLPENSLMRIKKCSQPDQMPLHFHLPVAV